MFIFHSSSSLQTKKFGEILGRELLRTSRMKAALVLGFFGNLGSGKTTFIQGLAKGLGIKSKITSPTFILIRRLHLKKLVAKRFNDFYHIDCYRLRKPKEIIELDFKKIISNPDHIVVVEWADRITRLLPKDALILKFKSISKNQRIIRLCYDKKRAKIK